MTPEVRLRLDRLVLKAAALEASDRQAFFDGLPEEERSLADEARRRLQAAETLSEEFLQAPATELLEAALRSEDGESGPGADEAPPIGDERYEIGERLGAGGMARVYRAFDRHLGRSVALKILQATDSASPRRSLREARAQARVRHDHVLDVYETGELGGRPYIAMRYVEGGKTLEDLGDLPGPASLEQKVRLVAQVAWGLNAAHREGLLHGDVKPSNVLVDTTPDGDLVARIGDFGIATDIPEDGPVQGSMGGALGGTPHFMAPELLQDPSSVDRRSDVYSLGVTLYQVLAGDLPPRGAVSWRDLRETAHSLPQDLAAVIARCLAPDPEDRYPSARAVAEDLQRFLDGEAVHAHADHLAYRLSRFVLRHRALVTVAGISALLLAAALVVAAVLGVRAVRANERADQRRAQAEELIGFTILDLRDKLEPVGRLDLLDEVGHRAMRYFAAVPEEELSDEELSRRSMALYQIGDVRMRRGDLAGAKRPFEESLALARELVARNPNDTECLFGLGQSEFWAGYALWERGDPDAARPHFEAYHEISERLVAREPESLDWRRELSYSLSNLGSLLEAQGELEGALERFRAALELDRALVADAPDPETVDAQRFELAATHNTVGLVLEQLGRLDEAQEHFEADVALRRELVERDPENQRWRELYGTSGQFLGNLLAMRGETAAARPHLEAVRDLFDELAAHDPENGDWRFKQAWSHLWMGRLEQAEGRHAEALREWRRADAVARELAALDPERADWRQLLGATRYHLALARSVGGPRSAAGTEISARSALEVLEPLTAERPDDRRTHRWLAESLLLLGDAAAERGDLTTAEKAWGRAEEAVAPFLQRGSRHPALVAVRDRVRKRVRERSGPASAW